VVHDYTAMDRILREEKKYIASICKKIRACGANVLLIQKSILRDAVTDLSLHYLAKMKIMVVTVRGARESKARCDKKAHHSLRVFWRRTLSVMR
jgi:chaperonin GroEL (HSP60 family)